MGKEDELKAAMDAAGKEEESRSTRKPKLTPTVASKMVPQQVKGGISNLAARLAPAAQASTVKQVQIADDFDTDTAFHVAFLGTGQGGSRIAQSFWDLGYRRVGMFNTTDQDWVKPVGRPGISDEIPKLSLDIGGASKDMQLARDNCKGREAEIWDLLTRSWGNSFDCALVCVSLGGGTGSGTALTLIQAARKYMEEKNLPVRVGAVVSLPAADDGQQVCRNAHRAFHELLAAKISPLLVIDNDRVNELYTPAMSELLPRSNEIVSQMFHQFNQLAAAKSEHVTFDRSEFAQLLDSGIVVMGAADIPVGDLRSPADVSTKIREDLANNVLAKVDLARGKKGACVFVAARDVLDTLSKDFFAAGFTQLDRIVGAAYGGEVETVIHRGVYCGTDPGLQCYTMIGDLDPPQAKLDALAKVGGVRGAKVSAEKHMRM